MSDGERGARKQKNAGGAPLSPGQSPPKPPPEPLTILIFAQTMRHAQAMSRSSC